MAPTCPKDTGSALSMKLLVDTKAGCVIYAEAGKDVVDFLFSLLTLPVASATVVKVLSKEVMVGCIGNLYGSVEKLDATYVLSADTKNKLLAPAGVEYESGRLLQLQASSSSAPAAPVAAVQVHRRGSMARAKSGKPIPAIPRPTAAVAGKGFVQAVVTYTIMDDLAVVPMSTISGITALRGLGVTDLSSLQEKAVQVGYNEGVEILRASLQSKTVLTDVFLRKNLGKDAVDASSNKKKLKATTSKKRKSKKRR